MFSEELRDAADALRAGDRDRSWQALQPILNYPTGLDLSDAQWAQGLGMLELIGSGSMNGDTNAALAAAREAPTNVEALYNAGIQLIDGQLPRIAATALGRANRLSPNVAALVNSLSSALERCGMYGHAFEMLRDSYDARRQDWFTRYLYSFAALMSGHVFEARNAFTALAEPADENAQVLYDRMRVFLDRINHIGSSTPLGDQDLRGWHWVLTNGILTHLSPHGFDGGMNGRYALLQDHDELIHESVIRAIVVFQAWAIRPDRLVYSNDRSSEILANVWHQRIGIPIAPYDPHHADRAALFVAYDLAEAEPGFRRDLKERRAGQVLVSHAACWTQEAPFVGDITTLLYQQNTAPWEAGLNRAEADTSPAAELAARIVATDVSTQALADLDVLRAFAEACGPPLPVMRDRFFNGSPVQSSRFH